MGTRCRCNPGGETNCPEDHVAICRRIDGQCFGSCHAVHLEKTSPGKAINYIIGLITNEKHRHLDSIISSEEKNFLRSGKYQYKSPENALVTVLFDLPTEVLAVIDEEEDRGMPAY